jgi:hypothetical protein
MRNVRMKERASPVTIVYFLESLSHKNPVQRTPNQAPNSRMATSQPFLFELLTASPIWFWKFVILTDLSSLSNYEGMTGRREGRKGLLENTRENALIVAYAKEGYGV